MNDDDETRAAPTAAAYEGQTEMVPAPTGAVPALAWSASEAVDVEPYLRQRKWRRVAVWGALLVAAGLAVAAGLILARGYGGHSASTLVMVPPAVSVTTTTVGAPPTAAAASPYADIAGTWAGHHRSLTVSSNGSVELHIIDSAACPQCAAASAPYATVHIELTSYDSPDDGKFGGYVKDTSDARVVPEGLPVEVNVVAAKDFHYPGYTPPPEAPGRAMVITIKGMPVSDGWNFESLGDASPFCDKAALGTVCGA